MNRVDEYLTIPVAYVRHFGDLRWHTSGEAIEYASADPAIGCTFCLDAEVAQFLEGFASTDRLIHFGYVLHLMSLFGFGRHEHGAGAAGVLDALAVTFHKQGRPARNAGALAAHLSRTIPRAVDPPEIEPLRLSLARPGSGPLSRRFAWVPARDSALPAISPAEFESHIERALSGLTPRAIAHWLAHGRPPLDQAAARMADELSARPPSLSDRLCRALERPRLAGAGAMVPHLEGALTLPSRRFDPSRLPTGGYNDLATRGQPEQILPFQLGLEPLEFLRRFAARELLYFHREEPSRSVEESTLILLDQGIRTWGDVRIILASAAVALGRRAAKRGGPLALATTANGGVPIDVDSADDDALGEQLEASDFTPGPDKALRNALANRVGRPRDVILLTHPRNLAGLDLAVLADALGESDRLFAASVDESGEVELCQLRPGGRATIGRCRVPIPTARARRSPPASAVHEGRTGDVEPIPFPFRLGPVERMVDGLFDFDRTGDWLLLANGRHGFLFAWRTDGSGSMMLPRPMVDGSPLAKVEAVIGVAGGFAVTGRSESRRVVLALYDFASRRCVVQFPQESTAWREHPTWHQFDGPGSQILRWRASADRLSVLVRPERIVLTPIRIWPDGSRPPEILSDAPFDRIQFTEANSGTFRPKNAPRSVHFPDVNLDRLSGTIRIEVDGTAWPGRTPIVDGAPALRHGRLIDFQIAGERLAALAQSQEGSAVYLSDRPGNWLGQIPCDPDVTRIALSHDGRFLARRSGPKRLEVFEVGEPVPRMTTCSGPVHARRLKGWLGDGCLLLHAGRTHYHLIDWRGNGIELVMGRDFRTIEDFLGRGAGLEPCVSLPASPEPRRFHRGSVRHGISVRLDVLGQAILGDPTGNVLAIVFVYCDRIAIWSHDGCRLGDEALNGGPPTPDAARRIGRLLANASLHADARREGGP